MIPHFPLPPTPTNCLLCDRPLIKNVFGGVSCTVLVKQNGNYHPPHFEVSPILDATIQYSFRVPDKDIHWCETRMFRIFYDDQRETLVQDDVDFEYVRDLAIRLYNLRAFA